MTPEDVYAQEWEQISECVARSLARQMKALVARGVSQSEMEAALAENTQTMLVDIARFMITFLSAQDATSEMITVMMFSASARFAHEEGRASRGTPH